MLSPNRVTLEHNGKNRPQPDRENAFAGASGGGVESSKISAQSPAVMRWQNCTRALVSERLLIAFSGLRPFGTSQDQAADRRLEAPPSPNQTQCAELRNQLTCLAFSFTPSFGRNHTELLEWRKT